VNPPRADTHSRRGGILSKLKRPDEAIAAFETALAIDQKNVAAFDGILKSAAANCDWTYGQILGASIPARVAQREFRSSVHASCNFQRRRAAPCLCKKPCRSYYPGWQAGLMARGDLAE